MSLTRSTHQPIRSCVVCRERAPRHSLIRVAHLTNGYQLDLDKRLGGRGSWLCHTCATTPSPKRLARTFRQHTPNVIAQLHTMQPAALAKEMEA